MKYIISIIVSTLCLVGCASKPPRPIPTVLPTTLVEQGWVGLPALTEAPPMYINPSKISPEAKEGKYSIVVISNLSKPQEFLGKEGNSVMSHILIHCSKKRIAIPFKTDVFSGFFAEGEYIYTKSTTMKSWHDVDESTDMKVLYHNICNR